jgi:hypothetical protein
LNFGINVLKIFAFFYRGEIQVALTANSVFASCRSVSGTQGIQSRESLLKPCRVVVEVFAVPAGMVHKLTSAFFYIGNGIC